MKKLYILSALFCALLVSGCQSAIDAQGKMLGMTQVHKSADGHVYFIKDGIKYKCKQKYYNPSPVYFKSFVPVSDAEWNESFR
jgi:hypothetical protein